MAEKQITHNGYLLVTVPEGSKLHHVEMSDFSLNNTSEPYLAYKFKDDLLANEYEIRPLPSSSNWQLIGLASEVIDDHSEMGDVIRSHNLNTSTTVILKQIEV